MKELENFKGNEIEFQKYEEKLKISSTKLKIVSYYDDSKKIKKYLGEIVNDKYEGRGILYNKGQTIKFDGYYKNGERWGFGREYNENRLYYEGFFKEDKYHGKGIFYGKDNKIIYNGHYYKGYRNGIGIESIYKGKRKMYFSNDKPESKLWYSI